MCAFGRRRIIPSKNEAVNRERPSFPEKRGSPPHRAVSLRHRPTFPHQNVAESQECGCEDKLHRTFRACKPSDVRCGGWGWWV